MCVLLLQAPLRSPAQTPLALEELWRIDGSGSLPITPNSQALVRTDGSSWITVPSNCALVLVRSDGQVAQRLGGCGTGPGQFRNVSAVGLYHDSLWVWDRTVGRLTLFAPNDRRPVRLLRLDFSRTAFRGRDIPVISALLGTNLVLAHRPPQPVFFGENDTHLERLVVLSLDGRATSAELRLDASSDAFAMRVRRSDAKSGSGEVTYFFANPVPPAMMTAVAQDGAGVAIVRQDDVSANEKSPTFTVSILGRELRQSHRWSIAYQPMMTDTARISKAHATLTTNLEQSAFSLSTSQEKWVEAIFEAPQQERPVVALGPLSANKLWLRRNQRAHGNGGALWQRLDLTTGKSDYVVVPHNGEIISASSTEIVARERVLDTSTLIVGYLLGTRVRKTGRHSHTSAGQAHH